MVGGYIFKHKCTCTNAYVFVYIYMHIHSHAEHFLLHRNILLYKFSLFKKRFYRKH